MRKQEIKTGLPRGFVIKLALISETLLLVIALLWSWLMDLSLPLSFSAEEIQAGILATGPLVAFNFGVFGILANRSEKYRVYREFRDEIVYPLCANLGIPGAIVLGICSGLGEEIFFRGVMQQELARHIPLIAAACISSLVFAYVHFIGMLKRFLPLLLFYFLFGLYFVCLFLQREDLTAPVIAHALYNAVAVVLVPYFVKDRKTLTEKPGI